VLFFGDARRRHQPRERLRELDLALREAVAMPPGLPRHAVLVTVFIGAAELAQGLADAEFLARGGRDAHSPGQEAAMALLLRLAGAIGHSWTSGFADLPELPRLALPRPLPEEVECRHCEGFSFYALYPEAHFAAATAATAAAAALGPATRVIGLRSIGLPLAAMVAAGLGTPLPPVTLRPVGHPFARRLALSEQMEAALLHGATTFALVDEGPGLSGSSLGALADFLSVRGVPAVRLHLFPGHAGLPGPHASPQHRELWQGLKRHVVGFDALALHRPAQPAHRLQGWAEDLIGPAEAPLEDISGGGWRRLRTDKLRTSKTPPADPQRERAKFLMAAGGRHWLLKFAGLGGEDARKARLGQALADAGLAPPVAGCRHGFLVQEWLPAARGLDEVPMEPTRLLPHLARYLGLRARRFRGGEGASPAQLWEMACHNTALALGDEAARSLRRQEPDLARLERGLGRVATDGRMQAWEWLHLPDGRLLKADALDHHAAHDLVGAQDIAWDLAGTEAELGLDAAALAADLARETGHETDPALLRFYRPCYLAFQLGAWTIAAEAGGVAPEETARQRAEAARHAGQLQRLLREA
jgi:hypothetical protein